MPKFVGVVGFESITVETEPGIYTEDLVERNVRGDILPNFSRRLENPGQINDSPVLTNQISIVADAFARENFSSIRYVRFKGISTKWKVISASVEYPRILLTLGGVYNVQQNNSANPPGDGIGES